MRFSLAAIGFHVIAASVRFDRAVTGTRICPLAARADPARSEAGAVEHAGQTFAQEDVVGGEQYLGADCGQTDH
jgi:hypothetical protein